MSYRDRGNKNSDPERRGKGAGEGPTQRCTSKDREVSEKQIYIYIHTHTQMEGERCKDVPRKKGGDSETCLGCRDNPFLWFVSVFKK